MAFFGVTKEKIKEVRPIPGADRIEVASLEDMNFEFVIMKGQFKPGDECLYLPIDSLLPEELIAKLGLTGKLAGSKRNRIKTVRLRGQISQGIVITPEHAPDGTPEEITSHLGITKYEPPEVCIQKGILVSLPQGQSMYDIEGADRYVNIAELLMDKMVHITEKLEGSNFSTTFDGNDVFVCQRSGAIKEIEGAEHTFWTIARRQNLLDFARELYRKYGEPVAVYGEVIGPGYQKNLYKRKDHEAYLFDIRLLHCGKFLVPSIFAAETQGMLTVPLLAQDVSLRGWLNGRTIKEASNGQSILNPDMKREGIVIKPMQEEDAPNFGRLIIKQRSPLYLAESDA